MTLLELQILDQHQHRSGGNRCGHRSDAEYRVALQRRLAIGVALARRDHLHVRSESDATFYNWIPCSRRAADLDSIRVRCGRSRLRANAGSAARFCCRPIGRAAWAAAVPRTHCVSVRTARSSCRFMGEAGRRRYCKGHELFADRFISLDHCTVVTFERRERRCLGVMLTHQQFSPDVSCLPAGVVPWCRSTQLQRQHCGPQITWRYGQ